jgi:8-oxo-dGTP pyrophosphatase MutT (NUDIX family)
MAKAKIEKSAGGVICREEGGRLRVALIATKGGERWGLPKGLVEKGEDPAQTALREVEEETGLQGRIMDKLGYVEYWFRNPQDDVLYHKFVDFYLMAYESGEVTGHDREVDRAQWYPIEEAIERLSFDNEREMLKKAKERWEDWRGESHGDPSR